MNLSDYEKRFYEGVYAKIQMNNNVLNVENCTRLIERGVKDPSICKRILELCFQNKKIAEKEDVFRILKCIAAYQNGYEVTESSIMTLPELPRPNLPKRDQKEPLNIVKSKEKLFHEAVYSKLEQNNVIFNEESCKKLIERGVEHPATCKKILELCFRNDKKILEKEDFFRMLKWIAAYQNSYEISEESVTTLPELPRPNLPKISQKDAYEVQDLSFAVEGKAIEKIRDPEKYNEDKLKYRGLMNLGSTCYMNSFVQALFMTKVFRYRLLSLVESENLKNAGQIPEELCPGLFQLQKLFAFLISSKRDVIRPDFLKAVLPAHFKTSHHQEDSSEFGRIYLDDLEKNFANTEEKDLIRELFRGEIVFCITCQDCQAKHIKLENLMDISLNFESRDPDISYNLQYLIDRNFEPLQFKHQNQFFCANCQNLSSLAIKTHTFTKVPPTLIFTLNRFYFDNQTFKKSKILSDVRIPKELNMTQQTEEDQSENIIYDLYAMVVHRGMTLDSGHYYMIAAEDAKSLSWILFDDSDVVKLEDIDPFEYMKNNKQDSPYMLFYQARNFFNNSYEKHKDFKLNFLLKELVEQDDMVYLEEQENKANESISVLNMSPQSEHKNPENAENIAPFDIPKNALLFPSSSSTMTI